VTKIGKIIMNILSLRSLTVLVLLLAVLPAGRAGDARSSSEKDGTLVVLLTGRDVNKSPVTNAYVVARGFVPKYYSNKSFVLKSSLAGRYEASLPPAVYDVFVSEGVSVPACKRVLIKSGSAISWTLQLESDDVYTEKSRTGR